MQFVDWQLLHGYKGSIATLLCSWSVCCSFRVRWPSLQAMRTHTAQLQTATLIWMNLKRRQSTMTSTSNAWHVTGLCRAVYSQWMSPKPRLFRLLHALSSPPLLSHARTAPSSVQDGTDPHRRMMSAKHHAVAERICGMESMHAAFWAAAGTAPCHDDVLCNAHTAQAIHARECMDWRLRVTLTSYIVIKISSDRAVSIDWRLQQRRRQQHGPAPPVKVGVTGEP